MARDERRRKRRGAIIAILLSALLGAGAATGAVVTVLKLETPDDQSAVLQGPADTVDPGTVIPYGG